MKSKFESLFGFNAATVCDDFTSRNASAGLSKSRNPCSSIGPGVGGTFCFCS